MTEALVLPATTAKPFGLTPGLIARHAVLITSTLVFAAPFVWMILLSFMPTDRVGVAEVTFPIHLSDIINNYKTALTASPMPRFLLNGAIVCAIALTSQILLGAPLAFALAKLDFPGRRALIALVVVALLLPHEVLTVPLFFICYRLGILDTYVALVLPSLISPTAVFLLYQFFRTVPDDLINAARIDGLGSWSITWRVMVPLSQHVLAAIAVLTLVGRWNELLWPAVAVTSPEMMPPTMGIVFFRDEEVGSPYGPLMAATMIATAPLILAFLFAQRRFIDSFTAGGAK